MDRRMFFKAGNDELGLQVVAHAGGRNAEFSANNEWCGNTETGFGATVTVSLSREDAARLRDFLDAWLLPSNAQAQGRAEGASRRSAVLDGTGT